MDKNLKLIKLSIYEDAEQMEPFEISLYQDCKTASLFENTL